MIDRAAIEEARARIGSTVLDTPSRRSRTFSERVGAEVYFKYETLQITGSFKVRGALNKMLALDRATCQQGVLAASAGNHAQGVAFSAAHLGIPATIVMPERTPQVKIENTLSHGSNVSVVLHGTSYDEAFAHARTLEDETGKTLIHPFNDPLVMAGQGTLGLELAEEIPGLDVVIAPIGGGGLIAGVATAIAAARPGVQVYGVQTAAAPAMKRSFEAGSVITTPQVAPSIAEGIVVKRPGTLTLEQIRRHVADIVLVDEEAIETSIVDLLENGKTVIEGAAAAAVAALTGPLSEVVHGRTVGVILSGGNIDLARLNLLLERSLAQRHRIARLRAVLADRPGSLAELLTVIARQQGNVVRVVHDRVFGTRFGDASVVVTLEVRDEAHRKQILAALAQSGHQVDELSATPKLAP